MSLGKHKSLLLGLAGLALALLASDLRAQGHVPVSPGPRRQLQQPWGRGPGPARADAPLRTLFLRVASLPPDEQQRVLENDEFFRRLPPMARERFRLRLEEFNALPPERRWLLQVRGDHREQEEAGRALFLRAAPLPPEEQQQALESDEFFQQWPPPAQQRFRQRLEEFNSLPAERRQMMLAWGERRHQEEVAQGLFLRLAPLPPEEQQRLLESDDFFQAQPPEAQQRFRQHLEQFNARPAEERTQMLERLQHFAALPAEEQERIRRRARLFSQMSPEQRQQAQQSFQAWQQLPPERRPLLLERLRRLQAASPEEQSSLLQDPEFLAPLEESERGLLRDLWRLRELLPRPAAIAPR